MSEAVRTTCACGRPVKARYRRCQRCRGYDYDDCACGNQKTRAASVCISCSRESRVGKGHNSWRGGRVLLKDGYVRIYAPDHPRAVNGRYVLEHILVMEQVLGRHLLPDERVHHINKVRSDNRPDNLELWSVGHPSGARTEDLLAWAHEVIERYGASK